MGYSLLENANRFMGKSVYEQEELEAKAKLDETDDEEIGSDDIGDEDETMPLDNGEEGDEDSDLEDIESEEGDEEGDEEGEEEDEVPLMPVEAAIRAIQMALNGEVESAEEALNLVQDMEDESSEDDELEGDELQDDELADDDFEDLDDSSEEEMEEGCDIGEECDKVVEEEEEEEEVESKPQKKFWDKKMKEKTPLPKDMKEIGEEEEVMESKTPINKSKFPKLCKALVDATNEYMGIEDEFSRLPKSVKDGSIVALIYGPFTRPSTINKGTVNTYNIHGALKIINGDIVNFELLDKDIEKVFTPKIFNNQIDIIQAYEEDLRDAGIPIGNVETDGGVDEDEKMYGEAHSKFLRLSARYL